MSNSPGEARTGFARMLVVAALPPELKVSFWIRFVGGILGLLGGILGMLASLVLLAAAPRAATLVLLLMLLAGQGGN